MALTRINANSIGTNSVAADELAATGVSAGTYGSSSAIPQFTVDEDGRLSSASQNTITNLSLETLTTSGNLTVGGDIIVSGDTITLTTQNLLIEDNIVTLTLNSSAGGEPLVDAGIEIDRGVAATVGLHWNETDDHWELTVDGTNYYEILTKNSTISANQLPTLTSLGTVTTGTWNADIIAIAYGGTGAATAGAARQNLGVEIGVDVQAYDADLAAVAGLTTTGLISRTGSGAATTRTITAGSGITVTNGDGVSGNPTIALTNGTVTINGTSVALGSTATLDTDDIGEGSTNVYYTDARVQTYLGAVAGSVIPDTNEAYDLGSATYRWRDLYLSGNTIDLGGTKVSRNNETGDVSFKDANDNLKKIVVNEIQIGSDNNALRISRESGTGKVKFSSFDAVQQQISNVTAYAVDLSQNNINDLADVVITNATLSAGQVLKYNGTNWINAADSSGIALTDLTVSDGGGLGGLTYNNATGVFTYVGPSAADIQSNFTAGTGITINSGVIATTITQYTDSDADARIAAASIGDLSNVDISTAVPTNGQTLVWNSTTNQFVPGNNGTDLSAATTTDLSEGTNLYYTDTRSRAAVSGNSASGISYNSGTGEFSLSSIPNASLANSSITVNGSAVSLGGTVTISAASSVSELTDVNLTSLSDGYVLVYDADNVEWVSTQGIADGTVIDGGSYDGQSGVSGLTTISIPALYGDSDVKAYLSGGTYDANIIPAADNTYDLGSPSKMWRDVYIGPGSLYINGKQVISDVSDKITVSTDLNQDLRLETSGTGDIEIDAAGTGAIKIQSTLQIEAGANITSSDGNAIGFSNAIAVDNVSSKTTNTNLTISANGTGYVYVDDNLVISGNLTVSGTTTTINTETVSIADNIIDLNSNFTTGVPTENSGIRVIRGDSANVSIRWNESTDKWEFTNDGSTYSELGAGTVDLTSFSVADNGGDGSLSYNNSTGVFTYTGPSASDVRSHFTASTGITITNGAIATTITQYTDSLARAAITVSGDLSYDNTTGVISYSTPATISSLSNHSTDALAEGSTNLYYTDARVSTYLSSNGYDTATNIIATITDSAPATLDTLNELAAALGDDADFATTVSTSLGNKLNTADFNSTANSWLSSKNTDNVTEGSTNLYYTDARARAAISVSGDLSYDSATGVISYTAAGGGGGASAINDLTDVDTATTAPTDGQALVWNSASSKWVPGDVAAGGNNASGSTTFSTSTFTGDGVTTAYNIGSGYTVDDIMVFENGVAQTPTLDYSVSSGNLVFVTAPGNGVHIQVRKFATVSDAVKKSIAMTIIFGG